MIRSNIFNFYTSWSWFYGTGSECRSSIIPVLDLDGGVVCKNCWSCDLIFSQNDTFLWWGQKESTFMYIIHIYDRLPSLSWRTTVFRQTIFLYLFSFRYCRFSDRLFLHRGLSLLLPLSYRELLYSTVRKRFE